MSHRTHVTLTDQQYRRLLDEAARSGVGLGELVRRAVERAYGPAGRDELLDALDASFGSWAAHEEDGATYVEALRRGMASRLTSA